MQNLLACFLIEPVDLKNFTFVLIRPEVAVKCATKGLVALEGVDNNRGILWPTADIATIPGTDTSSLRFKLEGVRKLQNVDQNNVLQEAA